MPISDEISKTSIEFQNKLQELVEDLECPKSAVPEKIGIAAATFSRAVNYGIIPKVKTLIRIADFFNISIEYLLCRTENDDSFSKNNFSKTFQERLEELKKANNLTYYKISQCIHIEPNYFSEWKKKGYYPSLEILILLADFFKVSIDYLLGRTDDQ